jgi:hypothetical protein
MSVDPRHINESHVNALARSYNVLDNSTNYIRALNAVLSDTDFAVYSKYELHSLINEILTKSYKGETILKAKLVEMFIRKEVTSAFEIKVNNSRVDFCKINGDTVSYEIKSSIDNLNKLAKQINDYEKVFEYNYIVVDEMHHQSAQKLIPDQYGVYVFTKNKLIENRRALLNQNLDPIIQLSLFTKRELLQSFKTLSTHTEIIKEQYSSSEINERFKIMLKKRYLKKWNFLKTNFSRILPIDYQYFFHHNIEPAVIYGH